MLQKLSQLRWLAVFLGVMTPGLSFGSVLQSSHFQLDPNVGSSFGGQGSSASYHLADTGGEAVVGSGSSTSYKLSQGYISHLPHSIQLSVLPTGVYSAWPLDTGTGVQLYDVTSTSNRAIAQGSTSWVAGKIGQALSLDGTSGYVSTSASSSNPNPFTLELWFKTTTSSGGLIMGFGNTTTGASATNDRNLYMTNGGQLIFGVNPGTNKTISSASSYNNGSWHHVVASLGPAGMVLLVDGARIATDGTTTTAGSYSGYWRLGFQNLTGWASAPTSNFFNGVLDEVHIYSRQLSDEEAAGDYTSGLAGLRFAHVFPHVVSGTSQTYSADAIVQTDAGGYDLYLQAISLLTRPGSGATIPMMASSVASPGAWTEGVTQGLGFTVTAGNTIEAKWGTGPSSYNYAGVPLAATAYHTRLGLSSGLPDKTTVQYRVDASKTQAAGTYSSTVIYTATLKP